MLRLPQLSDELWDTVYMLGRKHETEGSVEECRNHSRKMGQPQIMALSLSGNLAKELAQLPAHVPLETLEEYRPPVLVVTSVRSEGLTPF